MARSESYITRQKSEIMKVIKEYKGSFTVKDIFNELKGEIGLTTIYRFVDKMVSDGLINKNIGKNNQTFYQFLEKCDKENHFYLRCETCGNMEHIDCDCIRSLSSHILEKHKFIPNRDHIIINGICRKCGEKSEKK